MSMDDLLRATLEDLVGEARPAAGLAGRALVRGRRLRRRRRAVTIGTLLVIMVAASVPYAITRRDPIGLDVPPVPPVRFVPAPPFSIDQPFRVPGGLVVTSIEEAGRVDLLDRPSGRYERLPATYAGAVPSPDNRYVVGSEANRAGLRIRDGVTGRTRSIGYGADARPEWSPSGDQVVLYRPGAFTVLDAATGRATDHAVPADLGSCLDFCEYTWLGDGSAVALPQAYRSGSDPARVSRLGVFDAGTGQFLRSVSVTGPPLGAGSWSPDNQSVLIRPQTGSKQVLIVLAADGDTIGRLPADEAFFLPDGSIFGRYGAEVTFYDLSGRPRESMTLPAALATKTLTFGRL